MWLDNREPPDIWGKPVTVKIETETNKNCTLTENRDNEVRWIKFRQRKFTKGHCIPERRRKCSIKRYIQGSKELLKI